MSVASTINRTIIAIVPAAGIGRRVGASKPKQYLTINGKTVVEHTLEKLLLLPELEKVVVAVAAGDDYWKSLKIFRDYRIETVTGGAQRSHSVLNCIKNIRSTMNDDQWQKVWLMVHDVARPCVSLDDISRLMDTVVDHPVGGILAQAVTDTVKDVNADLVINKTLDRSQLWQAQTPQLFRGDLLLHSLNKGIEQGLVITDESSAIELAGLNPVVVEGSSENIKITQYSDLALAEFYLTKAIR